MARFRLSQPAEVDLANLLAASADRWGAEGRRRYSIILVTAMRRVAADPWVRGSQDSANFLPKLRSFHIRYARSDDPEAKVRRPVHILYYRVLEPGLIEIVRVLHERMEPSRHFGADI